MVKDGIFLGKRYEVLSKIGAGGMADVYKGRDTKLNRFVAIKVLKKEYREDEDFVRKFQSEAQAAAGLMNPNIVNVYDVGEDRGLYYMVMELVEGITLKDYIERKGRLSHKEVISIAIQMCTGIGAAHAAGIIHRDIKPQNIMISTEGKVKVARMGRAVWGVEGGSEEETAALAIDALEAFIQEIGMPLRWHEMDITDESVLRAAADTCLLMPGCCKRFSRDEIFEALRERL